MLIFCEILLCFFALCGLLYLCRDAYRIFSANRYGVTFSLLCDASRLADAQSARRAFLELSRLLSRPEAKRLLTTVYITNAAPHEMVYLYDAANAMDLVIECADAATLPARLRDESKCEVRQDSSPERPPDSHS